jgi:hypothetical protein
VNRLRGGAAQDSHLAFSLLDLLHECCFDGVISILGNSATDSIAKSLANSGIRDPKSPIQNPESI